jgi:hypothetical protein
VGLLMTMQVMTVMQSCVATTFVVWAEDPAAMERSQPALFQPIREAARMVDGFNAF